MSPRDLLRANDVRLLGVLGDLGAGDWAAQSLCAAWSNHDVLAHLVVGYSCAVADFAGSMVCHRGLDPANTALALRRAADRSPVQLLDDLARLIAVPSGLGRV